MFNVVKDLKRSVVYSACARDFKPLGAIIFLTYRCTSQCVACNIWQRPVEIEREMTTEQWKAILRSLAEAGVKDVELFGGDALLRKELLIDIISECRHLGMNTFFPTNSSSLTENTIESLVDAGLGTVYLSLDEAPSTDSEIRGVKRHSDRVIKALGRFRRIRGERKAPRISCITTVSRLNSEHLEELLGVSSEAGADEHMLRGFSEFTNQTVEVSAVNSIYPSPYFMTTDEKTHACNMQEARKLKETLKRIRKNASRWAPMTIDMTNIEDLSQADIASLRYPDQKCMFAATQVIISPYGNILPCLYYKNYHLGNAMTEPISSVWGNDAHRSFCKQQFANEIPLCTHCSIKLYHRPFYPALKNAGLRIIRKVSEFGIPSR